MSPIEARQDKNRLNVFLNISLKAQYNRTYLVLKMDDSVRTITKTCEFFKGLRKQMVTASI